jgi:hypothetical protein
VCEVLQPRVITQIDAVEGQSVARASTTDLERWGTAWAYLAEGVGNLRSEFSDRYKREIEELASAIVETVGEAGVRIAQHQPIGDLQSAADKPARLSDRKISAPLPATWEELRKQNSISQKQAAEFLECDPRTVRRCVEGKELNRSPKGRIVCNEHLRHQIRLVHGDHVLR